MNFMKHKNHPRSTIKVGIAITMIFNSRKMKYLFLTMNFLPLLLRQFVSCDYYGFKQDQNELIFHEEITFINNSGLFKKYCIKHIYWSEQI